MSASVNVYKPSGKTGNCFLFMPPLALGAAVILGIVYGYLNVYNPLIYVQFLVTGGAAYGLGYVLKKGVQLSHCRSVPAALAISLLSAFALLYVGWATFEYALFSKSFSDPGMPTLSEFIFAPSALWETAWAINEEGWFSIGKSSQSRVSGIMLTLCWIIEAGAILYIPTMLPLAAIRESVYCEDCKKWCKETKNLARFEPAHGAIHGRLKAGDLTSLSELPLHKGRVHTPYTRIDSQRCTACNATAAFQVRQVTHTQDKEGKWTESDTELSPHILYSDEELIKLSEVLLKKPTPPVPDLAPQPPEPAIPEPSDPRA